MFLCSLPSDLTKQVVEKKVKNMKAGVDAADTAAATV